MLSEVGSGIALFESAKDNLGSYRGVCGTPTTLLDLRQSGVPRGKRMDGQPGIGSSESNRHRPPWPIQKTSKKAMKMKMWKNTGDEEDDRAVEIRLRLNQVHIISRAHARERRRTRTKTSNRGSSQLYTI